MYVIYSQDAILKVFLLFPWWQEVSNNEWCRHKVLQYFWTKNILYRVADKFSLKNNHKSLRFNFFYKAFKNTCPILQLHKNNMRFTFNLFEMCQLCAHRTFMCALEEGVVVSK